jgi:CubicO group peptidase (beta-lactamase class C family)
MNRFAKLTFVVCLLAGISVSLCAGPGSIPSVKPEDVGLSTERLGRIHEAVQRHMDAGNISGAVTLVARRGKTAHFEAHGFADLEAKKPMAKDTIFRLASMSKPVTAVAVLMLVEEGKLRLNDPVSKFIPEFKDAKVAVAQQTRPQPPVAPGQNAPEPQYYVVPANREITIQDMLTHTSGLVSGTLGTRLAAKLAPRGPDDTLASYIPRLAGLPLDFQPGSEWAYSGLAGPDTLGRIVEIISGMTYDQFLKQRLFDPLGMKDTFFYPSDSARPRLVTLYQRSPQGLVRAQNQETLMSKSYFSGAGGLLSTAEDYLQFAQMLCNGGELNGKRFLGPRTVVLMASNHVGDMFNGKLGRPAHGMGFGFLVQVILDNVTSGMRLANGSFGWDGAFGTQVWVDPKDKMVRIIMMQTQTPQLQRDFENAVMQAIVE